MSLKNFNLQAAIALVEADMANKTEYNPDITLMEFTEYAEAFEDEIIINNIKWSDNFNGEVDNEIYHWQFGPYFITDKGAIFTKKLTLNQKEIDNARATVEFTKQMIRQGRVDAEDVHPNCFSVCGNIERPYILKIFKRINERQRLRFYIYPNKVKAIKELGYKVTSEKSHIARYNLQKDEYYFPMVHFTEIDVDAFGSMCKFRKPVRCGYRYDAETGEEVAIKRGRPSKEIRLIDGEGQEIVFSSKEALAESLGCSLSTVKRALKDKATGDIVTLRKKENFTLVC